jgi:hypothetical protein
MRSIRYFLFLGIWWAGVVYMLTGEDTTEPRTDERAKRS